MSSPPSRSPICTDTGTLCDLEKVFLDALARYRESPESFRANDHELSCWDDFPEGGLRLESEGDQWIVWKRSDGVQAYNFVNRSERWTTQQSADFLGLSIEVVYGMVQSGELEGIQLGPRWRIKRSSVIDYKRNLETEQGGTV